MLAETAQSLVAQWAENRRPAWSDGEVELLCGDISALSDLVTPHIVADVPLGVDDCERLLAARVETALGAWLVGAAATFRRSLRIGAPRRREDGGTRLGLRSASVDELSGMRGISRNRAESIARMIALNPRLTSIDDLAALPDVGPATLNALHANTYLDEPTIGLASPALLAFCHQPDVPTFLALLDASDLELTHGDESTWSLRPPKGGSTVDRFGRFVATVRSDAQRRLSPGSGVLASEGLRYLERQATMAAYRAGLVASSGALVVDGAYLVAATDLIASASTSVRLAIFLATASATGEPESHSAVVIEALEAHAATGVPVRVILDRDEPDDPYLSRVINAAVARRLRAAGVAVKRDEPAVLLHSKFLIADESSVLVGSHNLTRASLSSTHEVSVRIDNPAVAQSFADRFDALWGALPELA